MKRRIAVRIVLASAVLAALIAQAVVFLRAKSASSELVRLVDRSDETTLRECLAENPSLSNARLPASGDTILNYAVEQGRLPSVDALLNAGADPNLHGFSKRTALHIAVQQGNTNIVLRLLQAGADIESTGYRHDETPLHVASSHGFAKMVVLLLDHGAHIDSRNMQKETPLMRAVQNGHIETVRALLERGANPRLLDQRNRSALDFALKSGNEQIVSLLRNAQTGNQQSASSDESR